MSTESGESQAACIHVARASRPCSNWNNTGETPVLRFLGVALIVLVTTVIASAAPATSQPASIFDNQPIVRSHPTTAPATAPETFNVQRLITAMAVVLTLIFFLRYTAGWFFPATKAARGSRAIRVLTRTPIAPRQQVMLLHVGRRVIIVGESGGALSSLGHIQDPDEVAELIGQTENNEMPSIGGRFNAMFGRAKNELDGVPVTIPDLGNIEPVTGDGSVRADELADAQGEISNLISRMRALTQTVRKE